MSKVIGIDLGTTNSCVAVMEGGEAVVIPNAEGNRTTPSVVAFSKSGERMVGQTAKRQAITNPDRTIASIKREMGSDHRVNIDGKSYTPQEISAMILQKLKSDAEAYLGQPVTEAVITVPAYFTDAQRQATKDAGKIAGLDVKRIINEPTAAALAYGVDKEQTQKIMVYDLGGGTFDVSILEIDDGVIEVLATAGNNRLGGDDFDQCIMKYLVSEFKRTDGIDLSGDKVAMQRLKEAAEKAKIELSGVTSSNINLPYITADATGPKHLDVTLTRAKFNELTGHLVDATMGPVRQAMSDAGLKASDLSKVLMVGGSSRIPAVVEAVKKFTGSEPFKGINPDECVAMGAALQAGVLTGDVKGLLLLDVTPLSLGIETMGDVMKPLASSPVFTDLIGKVSGIPVLGLLLGTAMTLVVQSSSATIAVLQNFAAQPGADGVTSILGLVGAIPILLGDNIGTTITALLASLGQSRDAKRTAIAHTIFNLSGSLVFIWFVKPYAALIQAISPKGPEVEVISRQIANAHTLFNLTMTVVWVCLLGLMVKIVMWLIPDAKDAKVNPLQPAFLDKKVIGQPTVALKLVAKEVLHCSGMVKNMLKDLAGLSKSEDPALVGKIKEQGQTLHSLMEAINDYLAELFSAGVLTELQATQTAKLMHVCGDVERMGELTADLTDVIAGKIERK